MKGQPAFSNSTFWPTNSSRFVYSANFIKLKNLSLSYNVPQMCWQGGMRSVEIYVSGQNLFTVSNYPGSTRIEQATMPKLQGVETAVVPNARTIRWDAGSGSDRKQIDINN